MGNITVLIYFFVEANSMDRVLEALRQLPEIRDLYEVTGEYDVVAVVEAEDILAFRNFLKEHILKMEGIKNTVSAVVMHTHKRDGRILQ
ncbi:MAG: Lrp/AsnC ligand binding domain-containing protein [Euryarchaeota archaeon]|nr:Lrp/AsnC ligand binding domain-containing protein [Euryarchaeota archaeon]